MGSELSGKWRKVTLGEIIDLKYGFGLPERTRKGGNIPVYGSSGIVGWHDEATVKDLHFVYYLLKAQDFTYLNSDSAVPGLNRNAAYGVEVLLPPFSEQCRIASILSAFDDKIELNEQMNRTLEEMASAIFKSWFVDFEPFQDSEFEYNEKLEKEIPKGWEVKTVKEISKDEKVICGKTPSTKVKEYYGRDIPFITIPDMHGNTFIVKTER